MFRNAASLFLCLLLLLATSQAQSNYAVVRGSVVDPHALPVSGARVHITALETGAEREVVANTSGLYEIAGLQPGRYTLVVQSSGFKQSERALDLDCLLYTSDAAENREV